MFPTGRMSGQDALIYKDGEFTEEEANTVASLMWQIGANVDMGYSVDVVELIQRMR